MPSPELEKDEEIREYLSKKVEIWLTLTRQWREALGLPTNSLFTLAQDLVSTYDSFRLPQEISEWLSGWYKNPPMIWQKTRHPLALIEGSLLWKLSEEKNILFGQDLDNPYDPIIEFFEWGGYIDHEHGTLTNFRPSKFQIVFNAGIRESVYNTVYRDYWESLSKNQKKNKNRSVRNLK